jgi:2-dehydro-3-deoxyphosphogalactonate aldolase
MVTDLLPNRRLISILRVIPASDAAEVAQALVNSVIPIIKVPWNSPAPCLFHLQHDPAGWRAGTDWGRDSFDTAPSCRSGGRRRAIDRLSELRSRGHPRNYFVRACQLAGGDDANRVVCRPRCGRIWPQALSRGRCRDRGFFVMPAVLPQQIQVYVVGGAVPEIFANWMQSGATGFGFGTGHRVDRIWGRILACFFRGSQK